MKVGDIRIKLRQLLKEAEYRWQSCGHLYNVKENNITEGKITAYKEILEFIKPKTKGKRRDT